MPQRTFASRAGEGGGGRITLAEAREAADRNGVDTRSFDLLYEPSDPGLFGFRSFTGAENLLRGPTGRFQGTLTDAGLSSRGGAVNTIAHGLNHIREGLRTGRIPSGEESATRAGNLAQRHLRPMTSSAEWTEVIAADAVSASRAAFERWLATHALSDDEREHRVRIDLIRGAGGDLMRVLVRTTLLYERGWDERQGGTDQGSEPGP